MNSIVIAMTGASAMQIGERSVQILLENNLSVDLILSDKSVNLSGIKIVDEECNKDLNLFCLELSKKILKPDGALLIKSFNNSNLLYLKKEFEKLFTNVYIEKPLASKTSSSEVYLLGLVLK